MHVTVGFASTFLITLSFPCKVIASQFISCATMFLFYQLKHVIKLQHKWCNTPSCIFCISYIHMKQQDLTQWTKKQ